MTHSATLYDLPSRGVVRIDGPERKEFLNNLVTNSVDALDAGEAAYAALLTPQGKILFDFFVVETGQAYLVDCHGAFTADLIKRLSMYRLRSKAEITDVSDAWQMLAGDAEVEGAIAFADPRLPGLPPRLLAPKDAALSTNASEEDYLALLRMRGIPDVPNDAGQSETFLLEANFDELHGVNFKKGCYIGQELAARMKHRATVRKRLMPVRLEGAVPAPGTPVIADGREAGTIKSGAGDLAMAYLRLDRVENAETLTAGDTPLSILWPDWFPR